MTPEERVQHWNKTFPQYPPLVWSHDWIYGVWYCGTKWTKQKLYGEFPATFLKRALALFPDVSDKRLLQVCAGTVQGPGVTMDYSSEFNPKVQADARDPWPFPDGSFDVVLADPPYSPADAENYKAPYVSSIKLLNRSYDVLAPGGLFTVLDTKYPSYSRKLWHLRGLIAVVTGFNRATRMYSIFEKK